MTKTNTTRGRWPDPEMGYPQTSEEVSAIRRLEREASAAGDLRTVALCIVASGSHWTAGGAADETYGELRRVLVQMGPLNVGDARKECARIIAGHAAE